MGYTNYQGLTNRANSAMCRIEHIINMRHVTSAARLAMIAEVMADEPVLTDQGAAAYGARVEAREFHKREREAS